MSPFLRPRHEETLRTRHEGSDVAWGTRAVGFHGGCACGRMKTMGVKEGADYKWSGPEQTKQESQILVKKTKLVSVTLNNSIRVLLCIPLYVIYKLSPHCS